MKQQLNQFAVFILILIMSCNQPQTTENKEVVNKSTTDYIQHATGFSVAYYGELKKVEVKQPYTGATSGITYWLVPKSLNIPDSLSTKNIIRTPIERIVCTSTTHITPLELLEESKALIGFPSTQYISSEIIREQVESGDTREVGRDNNLNMEVMLDLNPEVLMTYSMTGDYSKLATYERSGIAVIQNAEYLEETPLGRAEWIKFMALFFNKEVAADSIFNAIANNYSSTLALVDRQADRPTVFSGIVYGDTWYMPGGKSWAGKFLNDAGADFLWKDNPESGSLELSFEAVFEKSHQADCWIGAGNYYSKDALKGFDERYSSFGAFQNDRVYTYNARQIPDGGNDYFESGFTRPDLVLNDLVKILYPEILPEHHLYYYRKLD